MGGTSQSAAFKRTTGTYLASDQQVVSRSNNGNFIVRCLLAAPVFMGKGKGRRLGIALLP